MNPAGTSHTPPSSATPHTKPRDTIYYDGQCNICTRSTAVLNALDWLDRLQAQDLTRTPPDQLPCEPHRALAGMPMRTRRGRTLLGFPAVRRALRQTPLGFVPALILHIPGIAHAANAAYNAFAANRPRTCNTPR